MRRLLRCLPLLPALLSAQAPAPSAAPSRIARVIVSPAQREVAAGDTLRLTAEARDAAGAIVPGVQFRFSATGGRFEGTVDQTGLVTAGATGTMPIAVAAILPGERPVVERNGTLIMVDDDRLPLQPGERIERRRVRFRTLGCYPLTGAVESAATTLQDIVLELLQSRQSERQGRVIDHDAAASMEKKKREGYF